MNGRAAAIDKITNAVDSMIDKIAAYKNRTFTKALDFHAVNMEDIATRCERCTYEHDPLKETLRIDGKDAVTITAAWTPGVTDHKILLEAVRHYLGESE